MGSPLRSPIQAALMRTLRMTFGRLRVNIRAMRPHTLAMNDLAVVCNSTSFHALCTLSSYVRYIGPYAGSFGRTW